MCMYVLDLREHQQISSQPQDIPCQASSPSSLPCSIKSTISVDATDQDSLLPNKDMLPVTPTAEQVLSASPDNVSMY